MRFKLIVAFVDDEKTDAVIDAAREAGATGVTVVSHARGEGLEPKKTFFGLSLVTQRDLLLLLVEEQRARTILEKIGEAGEFDSAPGAGVAVQMDVEDAVGLSHQVEKLRNAPEGRP